MTLHTAIEKLLRQKGNSMTIYEIADDLNKNKWYSKRDSSKITGFQIHGRTKKYPQLFVRNGATVSLAGSGIVKQSQKAISKPVIKKTIRPSAKDEHYVLDICDKILKQVSFRQHKFGFLLGDINSKGIAAQLPVDAYYEKLHLIVEYRERQHTEKVLFFDKPDRITVSGVHRGEQRRIYDERRRTLLPKNGFTLIEISYLDFNYNCQKRIIRNEADDMEILRRLLHAFLPTA